MHNFIRGLATGVIGLTTAEYFIKYNLLDTIKDNVNRLTGGKLGDLGSLALVVAVFALLLYLAYR